jgi:hypothetical protein
VGDVAHALACCVDIHVDISVLVSCSSWLLSPYMRSRRQSRFFRLVPLSSNAPRSLAPFTQIAKWSSGWCLHRSNDRGPLSDLNSYTCPEYTLGSYYSGPTRISLVETSTRRIVNTGKPVTSRAKKTASIFLTASLPAPPTSSPETRKASRESRRCSLFAISTETGYPWRPRSLKPKLAWDFKRR